VWSYRSLPSSRLKLTPTDPQSSIAESCLKWAGHMQFIRNISVSILRL
jgi:hypothetical protein